MRTFHRTSTCLALGLLFLSSLSVPVDADHHRYEVWHDTPSMGCGQDSGFASHGEGSCVQVTMDCHLGGRPRSSDFQLLADVTFSGPPTTVTCMGTWSVVLAHTGGFGPRFVTSSVTYPQPDGIDREDRNSCQYIGGASNCLTFHSGTFQASERFDGPVPLDRLHVCTRIPLWNEGVDTVIAQGDPETVLHLCSD